MEILDRIAEDIKAAMRAKDRQKLEALRSIKKEIIEARTAKGAGDLDEGAVLKIIQKLVKQRKDSAAIYQEQGRQDLAENELTEAAAIEVYLPAPLSEEELVAELQAIIEQTGASSPKDMGKVMGLASKKLAGKADGKTISTKVRELLA